MSEQRQEREMTYATLEIPCDTDGLESVEVEVTGDRDPSTGAWDFAGVDVQSLTVRLGKARIVFGAETPHCYRETVERWIEQHEWERCKAALQREWEADQALEAETAADRRLA